MFAPGLSFFFNSHVDFFEEVAKFRAGRRIWARRMREDYGARDPRSWMLRFHTQTAGVSLTAQQPFNNVARTALEALAAVLGGTQSLHTNSLDEVLALPTEEAAEIALRTQQIIAYETGAGNVADPLGGSWFVEDLTDRTEAATEEILTRVRAMGEGSFLDGTLAGIRDGYFQQEMADAAFRYQRLLEENRKVLVGVNRFTSSVQPAPEVLVIGPETEKSQRRALAELRAGRDEAAVERALRAVREMAAQPDGASNSVPVLMEAARAYVTLGEMVGALKESWGIYVESPSF